jgi:hypothetical protein
VTAIGVAALADALIERSNPRLPRDCRLERGASERWEAFVSCCSRPKAPWGGRGLAALDEVVEEELVPEVVEDALDAIQDEVAHATRGIAWPSGPEASVPLPRAWARAVDGVLSFGYGSRMLAADVRLSDLAV